MDAEGNAGFLLFFNPDTEEPAIILYIFSLTAAHPGRFETGSGKAYE